MSNAPTVKPMTSDELFAMRPSKTVDRWLFRGELRECQVIKRNPSHSRVVSNVTFLLNAWVRARPLPRGAVYTGEAYFRIRRDPETNVGIDIALSTSEQVEATKVKASFVDGPPVLAVEVLSPYDKQKDITEAIEEYLECGVKQVWIVDPYAETVTVFRPDAEPELYARSKELPGGEDFPGFRCRVADIFE